jgi:AraC-like DNA-binding protein
VSGILIRALADTVLRYDVEPSALVEGHCDVLAIRAPFEVRMPVTAFGRMLSRAAELTGESAIGLLCGLEASDSAFDLLAPLVAHVADMRHAIQETSQFEALAFEGSSLHLTEAADVARVRCEFPRAHDSTDRYIADFLVGGLMRMLRGFGNMRRDLIAACFEHRRPAHSQAYTRIFQGKERFSQEFTGLEFDSRLLDRPHLHANPALQSSVHLQAELLLERLARPDFIDRLRTYLLGHPGLADMTDVARDFGMSVRSLRRRLDEAGLTYRSLIQEMQGKRACMLLRNPNLTIKDVADAVGYTDTGAFRRAFRRWTGLTALDYRRSMSVAPLAESTPP